MPAALLVGEVEVEVEVEAVAVEESKVGGSELASPRRLRRRRPASALVVASSPSLVMIKRG